MRWILPFALLLTATACCPCQDEPKEVADYSPEEQARRDWYAAYPDWAMIEGTASEPRSPQHQPLHDAAQPEDLGDAVDRLLVCHVSVVPGKNWDTFGDPDPAARLEVDGQPFARFAASGLDDNDVYLGWTGLSLTKGATVRLTATDMDVARHDHIGTRELVWDGRSPIQFRHKNFSADCRFIADDEVKASFALEIADAEARLDEMEAALVPDPEDLAWGYPAKATTAARRAVSGAAALSGWRQSEVKMLAARYDGLESKWEQVVETSIRKDVATLPKPGSFVALDEGLSVSVVAAVCDPALANKLAGYDVRDKPCFARLHVRNTGSETFAGTLGDTKRLDGIFVVLPSGRVRSLQEFYAVLPDKRRVSVYRPKPDAPDPTFELAPGATMEIGVRSVHDKIPMDDCQILRAGPHRLRLR